MGTHVSRLNKSQKEYRNNLRCPYCGSFQVRYVKKRKKMECEKCGHDYERPLFRERGV